MAKKKPARKTKAKEEEEVTPVIQPEPPLEVVPPMIENIRAEKLEGPKILGKIELPTTSETRPKKEEKRKRKRIPIEKKEVQETSFRDRQGVITSYSIHYTKLYDS